MPESKVRKAASRKKTRRNKVEASKTHKQKLDAKTRLSGSRDWVPWVFVPLGLLGVLWLVVFYIAGTSIPFMLALGNWNFAIGIGLITSAFVVSTLWK